MIEFINVVCVSSNKAATFQPGEVYTMCLDGTVKNSNGYNFGLTAQYKHDSDYGCFEFAPLPAFQVITDRAHMFATLDAALKFVAGEIYLDPRRKAQIPNELNEFDCAIVAHGFNSVWIKRVKSFEL